MHLYLVKVNALFKSLNLDPVLDLVDRMLRASRKDGWTELISFISLTGLISFGLEDTKASEVDVGHGERVVWIALTFLRVQPPHVDSGVESGRDEACIVLQPRN